MKVTNILLGVGAAVAAYVAYNKLIAPKKASPTPADQTVAGFFAGAVGGAVQAASSVKESLATFVSPAQPTPASSPRKDAAARRVAPLGSYDIGAATFATQFTSKGLGAQGA